jgi:protein SCO1
VAATLAALDWRPGDQFRVVTVSIDPAETRHEAVRARQALLDRIGHPDEPERWPFLVGEKDAIRALADSLGFGYVWDARTKQFAHPAVIFALAPDGTISHYLYGVTYAAGDVKIALLDASEGRTGSYLERVILSCFRFDPALRVYGGTIERFFKVGAVIIFCVVGAILFAMFRRERGRA